MTIKWRTVMVYRVYSCQETPPINIKIARRDSNKAKAHLIRLMSGSRMSEKSITNKNTNLA